MAEGDRLVWIDLEMTGLDPEKERIIEMATIITDSELNVVAEGPVIAVHQPTACWMRWMNGAPTPTVPVA